MIAIIDQVLRCLVPRKGLSKLLGRPRGKQISLVNRILGTRDTRALADEYPAMPRSEVAGSTGPVLSIGYETAT